jgi:protein-S-isoprenylcysteine O-methyltransferase Ste14
MAMTPTQKLVFQLVISILVILGFFGFVFALFFFARAIDPSVKESLTQISGALIAAFGGVVGFWLGTSLSSASKDNTISQLTKQSA